MPSTTAPVSSNSASLLNAPVFKRWEGPTDFWVLPEEPFQPFVPPMANINRSRAVPLDSLLGLGLAGDFNSDGIVDGSDFLRWQATVAIVEADLLSLAR